MKTSVHKITEDGSTEIIECKEADATQEKEEKLPTIKLSAFTLFEHFINTTPCVSVDGVLHIFDPQTQCYLPFDKKRIESYLFEKYRYAVSQTGSLRIIKGCAEMILRHTFGEVCPADKQMILCFQNGFLPLSDINQAVFYYYDFSQYNPCPTFHINCDGFATMTDWGAAKSLPTPWMDHFLHTSSFGIPKFEDRVWEMLGYLLSPDHNGKCFFVLQGLPNSGKSILGKFIQSLYPNYRVENLDIDQLNKQSSTKKLVNKSINISMDLPNKALSPHATRSIKLITGNDTITVELKNGEYEAYDIDCKFLFATNHTLTLRGVDSGLEERLVCVPFTYTIPSMKRNHNLLNCLLSEKQFIVAKALAYYRDLKNRGYIFSGSEYSIFKPRIRYLPTEADDIDASFCDFIENHCTFVAIEEKKGIHTDDLYNAYLKYCTDCNETPISNQKAFSRKLSNLYGTHVKNEKWRKPGAKNPTAGFYGILLQPMQEIYNV